MKSFLLLLVCVIGLQGIGKATLVIRQGRITTSGPVKAEIFPVVGIATVELGGNDPALSPTYFFDCISNVPTNTGSGIIWTRMAMDSHRFDISDIPGGNVTGRRMNAGGITYDDLGVYICSDSANDDSVSVNITGSNPAIVAVRKQVKVIQGQSVALEVYASGYPTLWVTWHYPNHSAIMEHIEGEVKFQKGRKKLILSNVHLEQAGLYSCQVTVSLDPYLGAKAEIQLQIFAKPILHAFSADPIHQEADNVYSIPLNYIGTVLVCAAEGWPSPDLDVKWKKNGVTLHREREIISEWGTSNSDVSVQAELTWTREFRNSDGVYKCIMHQRNTTLWGISQSIELKAVTATTHTETDRPWTMCTSSINKRVMYFQIRIVGVDCLTWMELQTLKEHIATEVHQELLLAVEYECNCAVDESELQLVGAPQCSVQMDDAAVFHGIIQTNSLDKTRLIFCALSFWLEGSAQLQIDDEFLVIDSSCPLEASETLNEECIPPVIPSSNNNVKEVLVIAGGIGGFVVIVILLISVVCCIGCFLLRTRKNSKNVTKEVAEGDHTYDHIDFHSRYSSNINGRPNNVMPKGSERAQATVSIELGAESLYSYGQFQPSKITDAASTHGDDTEDQIYERISNLDLQLESEEAQPYSVPVKANTTAV